jgi:AraC-like DNA-binding protein
MRIGYLGRAVSLFDELVATLERGEGRAHLMAAAGIAWNLLTQMATDRILSEPQSPAERVRHYLGEHLDRSVTVTEMAEMVGLSSSRLRSVFKEATGTSVVAYHTAARMEKARVLLSNTRLSITEVAASVGYGDPLYFSRRFRKLHALSPTAYRIRAKD